ncbi:MAG TPA: aminoacyl-tRNA hydrolase [Thermoleophilaceae bacterium]
MGLFRRGSGGDGGGGGKVDWLIVGLGNPGDQYARTRHNIGFEVVKLAAERWQLPKPRRRYAGLYTDGRTGPGGPRVGVLMPQTFMNDSGRSAGPARGALKVELDRVVAVLDEIDLPFGEVRVRLGGGLAGHNGLKSLKRELGSADFQRLRVGVGRPDSTDPEIVSAWVLGRFREPPDEVRALIERAADELERLVTAPVESSP